MRHDETDDRLPPTQRRGRNAWDALAESMRVLGRGIAGFGRLVVSPGGIFLIVLGAIAAGWIGADTLDRVAQILGDFWEKVKP